MQTQQSNEEVPAAILQQVAALNAEQVSALREATAPKGVLLTLLNALTAGSAKNHLMAIPPRIDGPGREVVDADKVGVAATYLKGEYVGQMMVLDLLRVLNLATLPVAPVEEIKPNFGVEEVK